ncbi:MAG TPA: cbb3-type cytochrome c oxidase subunit I, partial [Phycisphaerales bacterium]|nr:cbb3-type cytochrome c oxidase subunit I [Phycisphaerales bacterium]
MTILQQPLSPSRGVPALSRLHEWVATTDHKKLGVMYVTAGLMFFVIAGIEGMLMRWQLAGPGQAILMPDDFNRLFTMHGTTMVFFVGMPILFGTANFIVPLQIGARDLAFPRLNAFGFWLFLLGGLLLYFSYFGGQGLQGMGSAPDVGWFAYAPLSERTFSRGHSTDYWILGILLSGIGSTTTAINLIATIIGMRCPG